MKVLMANIEDVMREAAARWTLVAYFFLSTIFILIFASAINLDIVEDSLSPQRPPGRSGVGDLAAAAALVLLGGQRDRLPERGATGPANGARQAKTTTCSSMLPATAKRKFTGAS